MSCSEQCEIQIQLNNALACIAELERKYGQVEQENEDQLKNALARIAELEQKYEQAEQENARKEIELNWLREQFRLNKQRQFGHSKDSSPEQLALFHFNEAEASSNPKVEEPELTVQPAKASSRKRKPPREGEAIWEKLPRMRTVHKLPEEELVCPECGDVRRKMSEEVRRELRVIPVQFYVEEIVQEVYVCDGCQREGEHSPIATAEAPKPPIAKSFASAALLAYVATLKYCDGLPLYRMEQMFKRMDLDIRRQNLGNWMIQISKLWLKLLHDELHRQLLTRDIVHSDETSIQVLRESGRKPQTKSSMWLYCSGSYDKRAIVLFEYQQSKEAKWPKAFLQGYAGYLNVDGASTYEAAQLLATILVGCWSHAKRGFVNALKAAPSGSPTWGTHAYRGQEFCDMLFDLEREYDKLGLTAEERHQQRQLYSRAVLDAFHHWLVTERANVLSKSYTGKAMDYCLRQWPKLTNFLLDGRLEITNNLAERAIKPFVIGRKGWLFSNSTKGAAASAVIYSIIETAKANNLKPFEYLKWLLTQMPNLRLTNDTLQSLLPWSDTIPPECKMNLLEV